MSLRNKTGIALMSVVLLSGCSLFGGQPQGGSPSSPTAGGDSPASVLRAMQAKVQDREMKSGNVAGKVNFDFTDATGKGSFSMDVNADFDVTTKGKEAAAVKLAVAGEANTLQFTGKGSASADFAILEEAKMFFARINEVKATSDKEPMLQTQIDMMMQQYVGTWWKFPIPEGSSPFSGAMGSSTVPADQEAKIKELVKTSDLFKVTKDYGTESVNGVNAYHYGVEVDADGMVKFAREVAKITDKPFTSSDETEMRDGLKKVNLAGEVWIGVEDKFVYKAKLSVDIDDTATGMKGKITGELALDSKKKVSITAPADAKEFIPPAPPAMPAEYDTSLNGEYDLGGSTDLDPSLLEDMPVE